MSKPNPTPRQADALLAQRARGTERRNWWHSRKIEAENGREKARAAVRKAAEKLGKTVREMFGGHHPAAEPLVRGLRSPLTSIPGRLDAMIQPTILVDHQGYNHAQRRRLASLAQAELRAKAALQDAELDRSRAMRRQQTPRPPMQPATNRPYRSPERPAKLARSGRLRRDQR